MSEKPRIKETDEILDSIGKQRGGRTAPVVPGERPPAAQSAALPAEEAAPSPEKRRGRPRKSPEAQQESPPREREDRNPLDFSKYELPSTGKRRGRPRKNAPAASENPVEVAWDIPQERELPPPPAAKSPRAQAAPAREDSFVEELSQRPLPETPPPTILRGSQAKAQDFTFEDLQEASRREERRQLKEQQDLIRRHAEREERRQREEEERLRRQAEEEAERARKQAAQEAERALRQAQEEADRIQREAEEEAERLRQQAEAEAERLRREKESRRKLLEDDNYREDILDKLGDQFEQQFSQRFELGDEPGEDQKPWWLEERREGLGKPVREQREPQPEEARLEPEEEEETAVEPFQELELEEFAPEEAAEADPQPIPPEQEAQLEEEAENFMRMFEQEVLQEENDETADFRETLAQKFMRERERYLRDLGIADQIEADEMAREEEARALAEAEAEAQQAPPRRKLDFQIRPEMHAPGIPVEGLPTFVPPPEPPPRLDTVIPPMTYNRAAMAVPQTEPEPEPAEETGFALPIPKTGPDGKKTAEQLLLELGQSNQRRSLKKPQKQVQKQFNFRFAPVGEEEKGGKKSRRRFSISTMSRSTRVIALSAVAALMILSLLVWAFVAAFGDGDSVQPMDSDDTVVTDSDLKDEVLYDSFNPEKMTRRGDVTVKRSGLTISNLTVQNRLVVEEEASAEGYLSLSNVIVGDYIYIRSSGINRLDLRDVQAQRIIINNDKSKVTVNVSGFTDVEGVEVRTPVIMEQSDLSAESPGIRSVTVQAADYGSALPVSLTGVQLGTVITEGETELSFDTAAVENLSADGDLSVTGNGKVTSLSFGLNMGGGATGSMRALPATLLVKGVEIGTLNVKSAANLTLSSAVDAVFAEDPMIVGGNGTIGTMVLNERFGNGRLSVSISGVNIQQLITNTEALIEATGSSTINTLTANESTWALGNKVNLLRANADGVIYENEPDSKQVATGIDPPQSKAENPNINYSLGYDFSTDSGEPSTDATGDDVGTTCNHSREVGGFVLGDGSRLNPFIIETAAQLAHITEHPGSYYLQANDIDIADDSSFADGFPMIGADGMRFSGVYDGAGYSLYNLRLYAETEVVGLFAENTGTIRNVHIASGELLNTEYSFAGGIVGMNFEGGVVENCSNGMTITADYSAYAGGIVGYNYGGKIRDCYNTAKVAGGDTAGGIVGLNRQSASVTGCYNIGVVTADDNEGSVAGSNEGVITNCYYLESGDLEGVGDGEGNAVGVGPDRLGSAQMAAELAAGDDNSLWQFVEGGGYSYPTLKKPTRIVE